MDVRSSLEFTAEIGLLGSARSHFINMFLQQHIIFSKIHF